MIGYHILVLHLQLKQTLRSKYILWCLFSAIISLMHTTHYCSLRICVKNKYQYGINQIVDLPSERAWKKKEFDGTIFWYIMILVSASRGGLQSTPILILSISTFPHNHRRSHKFRKILWGKSHFIFHILRGIAV